MALMPNRLRESTKAESEEAHEQRELHQQVKEQDKSVMEHVSHSLPANTVWMALMPNVMRQNSTVGSETLDKNHIRVAG